MQTDRLLNQQLISVGNITVVSEVIDVLVQLTALTPNDLEIYYQKPTRGKVAQKFFHLKA